MDDFYFKFLSIPYNDLPIDDIDRRTAIISEAIRLSFISNMDNNFEFTPMHILSLKNWVLKKLRSIIPEIQNSNIIEDVINNEHTLNLKFIGNIIELSDGYYIPAPTRVIQLNERTWALLSGLPTKFFIDAGIKIKICGIYRSIEDISKDEIVNLGIPIQTIDSFTGINDNSSEDLLKEMLSNGWDIKWYHLPELEAYSDKGSSNRFDFPFWGDRPLEIEYIIKGKKINLSLWRNKQSITYYLLRVGIKRQLPRPELMIINRREQWIMEEYDYYEINLPNYYSRKMCLLIESLSNNKRKVKLHKNDDNFILISMDFYPFEELLRLFCLFNGRFEKIEDGRMIWKISYLSLDWISKAFNNLGVEINID